MVRRYDLAHDRARGWINRPKTCNDRSGLHVRRASHRARRPDGKRRSGSRRSHPHPVEHAEPAWTRGWRYRHRQNQDTATGWPSRLAAGVPVFAADIKGSDLSGIASPDNPTTSCWRVPRRLVRTGSRKPARPSSCARRRRQRCAAGDHELVRPGVAAAVLDLNEVQESSLGLVFHYADQAGLPLLDLSDLRAVLTHLTSDEAKAELKNIGGLSASTVGVILRTLITFADQGADAFFGEPEFDTADLLRVTGDGGEWSRCWSCPT